VGVSDTGKTTTKTRKEDASSYGKEPTGEKNQPSGCIRQGIMVGGIKEKSVTRNPMLRESTIHCIMKYIRQVGGKKIASRVQWLRGSGLEALNKRVAGDLKLGVEGW